MFSCFIVILYILYKGWYYKPPLWVVDVTNPPLLVYLICLYSLGVTLKPLVLYTQKLAVARCSQSLCDCCYLWQFPSLINRELRSTQTSFARLIISVIVVCNIVCLFVPSFGSPCERTQSLRLSYIYINLIVSMPCAKYTDILIIGFDY